ncbi:MAG: bifunctional DNA-formamidopyrimidine glycosylase/DNA-(apurinic or apyrimidinic site) lyase [Desulfobacterales bacterium]|jgi:formamidopyrimidine-DNA glycosylase
MSRWFSLFSSLRDLQATLLLYPITVDSVPELPEVQTVVNDLIAAGLVGQTIANVHVRWPGSIAGMTPERFRRKLKGRRIENIQRRAKFIVWRLDEDMQMLTHLRMTGRFHLVAAQTAYGRHDHLALTFGDRRQLRFQDTRKFGRFYLPGDNGLLARLGPEPLSRSFTARCLETRLKAHRRQLKPLLLDQHFVAGLGNIYVDEALWQAGLHPTRRSNTLATADVRRLHRAIRKVLRKGLQNMGTTLGTGATTFYSVSGNRGRNRDQLSVFRRTGQACPRCRTMIDRLMVAQRSTHICPVCQK